MQGEQSILFQGSMNDAVSSSYDREGNVRSLQHRLQHAVEFIANTYGHIVYIKPKPLLKFGKNPNVGSAAYHTIMQFQDGTTPEEVYVSDNSITHVMSSATADVQTINVETHYYDEAVSGYRFLPQDVTLQGQTPVALGTPASRANRAANEGTAQLVGTVAVAAGTANSGGVPTSSANTHLQLRPDFKHNQSFKAATMFSYQDYGIITQVYADINKKQTAQADVRLQVRKQNKLFQTKFERSVNTDGKGGFDLELDPCIIVPTNSDVWMQALASSTGVSMTAGFDCYLALVVGTVPS